ncbi:MAG: hypothetical protein ACK4V1_08160 [Burkholderiaceae bacterium]
MHRKTARAAVADCGGAYRRGIRGTRLKRSAVIDIAQDGRFKRMPKLAPVVFCAYTAGFGRRCFLRPSACLTAAKDLAPGEC